MNTKPQHVTPDDGREVQLAVHGIARNWIFRGFCPECVIRQIVLGASAVAQDAGEWPADHVHKVVDDAFSADANHVPHARH